MARNNTHAVGAIACVEYAQAPSTRPGRPRPVIPTS
jgi:hypothetical protein